jgi:hypothetical protein
MDLGERLWTLLKSLYAACQRFLGSQGDERVSDQPLKREEIQERERLKALRELDRLRNQRPEN